MAEEPGFDRRFDEFIDQLSRDLHRADWCGRDEILHGYCRGLLIPGERKSMEPIAARMAPEHASASREAVQLFPRAFEVLVQCVVGRRANPQGRPTQSN